MAAACLRWLGRAEPNLAEAMDAVQRIIRDANRAAAVIAHTRALLRKSGGDKASLDITEVIRETLVLVQPEVLRHRIVIRESLAEDLPTLMGDRIQLQQVLLNLIMNGIEAMTAVEDGHRELAIRAQRHEVEEVPGILVAVRDAGVGIAPESLDRLFDAFYTTKAQGLGMGLSISRSIIQGHGGRLWATANAGPGATLQFAIPAGNKRRVMIGDQPVVFVVDDNGRAGGGGVGGFLCVGWVVVRLGGWSLVGPLSSSSTTIGPCGRRRGACWPRSGSGWRPSRRRRTS